MNKISNVTKGERIALFNNIGIETSSKCNRHCFFCPNDYHDRPDQYMPDGIIDKIIYDLAAVRYKGRVELYIYNEPTRDKRLVDIIKKVRHHLPSACIMINTNGDYFKGPQDIVKYFEAGLNQMQINIYSNADRYTDKRFEVGLKQGEDREQKMSWWLEEAKEILGGFGTHSLYQNIGPKKRAAQVICKYGVRKESTSKDMEGVNHLSNRSGNIPDFHSALTEPLKKHCTRPFRFLNINWKGDSILCCNDYYGETFFGNVKDRTLDEIWNDVMFHKYRLKLQNKNRDCFLCDKCDFNGGYYPHMINKVTFGKEADKKLLKADIVKEVFKRDGKGK